MKCTAREASRRFIVSRKSWRGESEHGAWAVQRGTAFLTTSVTPSRIRENFDPSPLPEDAMQEIRNGVATNIRFNSVVQTGVPGFIPRSR